MLCRMIVRRTRSVFRDSMVNDPVARQKSIAEALAEPVSLIDPDVATVGGSGNGRSA